MATDDQPTAPAPKTVLIVEDNAPTAMFLHDLLQLRGYTILMAESGQVALNLAREHKPDLILLDIQLPDISGMEVARQLKGEEATRTVPIIAATAFAMSRDRAQIIASGCDDYIAKPFKARQLLAMIRRHMP
jgi:two-component system cell cycle response regulator DivK